ncbi:hypothetical protein [Nocardia cyriacigeorgica]|uniref:Uncharacterized protein n=1 Tax=Nocardia cyriacigeorgica TaxID=135487 RepID=A0A4U8VTN2_9NOCA|nr:hypothetical protein [Nocardia cyriacigeorgica]VFA96622.1 Uncharacterised protein [Nocardia cyriacigeorgica]
MNRNRERRQCRSHRPHRVRRHRELTLRHGDDLSTLPPLIRVARCASGKLTYFSFDDADLALTGIDRDNPRRREQRVYLCPICRGWHLTSQELRSQAGNQTAETG